MLNNPKTLHNTAHKKDPNSSDITAQSGQGSLTQPASWASSPGQVLCTQAQYETQQELAFLHAPRATMSGQQPQTMASPP
jgi:hypothetical protein